MMTSSNGNIFRVAGPLCGEFTEHWWIPLRKATDAELWCFLWSVPEQTVEWTIAGLVIWDALALITTLSWYQEDSWCPHFTLCKMLCCIKLCGWSGRCYGDFYYAWNIMHRFVKWMDIGRKTSKFRHSHMSQSQWRNCEIIIDMDCLTPTQCCIFYNARYTTARFGTSLANLDFYIYHNQLINVQINEVFNSSPPSAAYMRPWIGSALVQIMACRIFGAKPLSKPLLGYCQLQPWVQTSMKF